MKKVYLTPETIIVPHEPICLTERSTPGYSVDYENPDDIIDIVEDDRDDDDDDFWDLD